ncbi:MAG: OmpA family protein [Spirochaetaceae bacterium]|nr:OmpA family protein [Spirochaetaceae bacterium]
MQLQDTSEEKLCGVGRGVLPPKTRGFKKHKKIIFLVLTFLLLINGLYAQTGFPNTEYWSLDGGLGMTDILVEGKSFQFILDPKLSISHALMVGARFGVNYSTEDDDRDILTFETQAYLRWNFLRFGKKENTTNAFIQGGMGLLAAYRGEKGGDSPFSDVTMTRGSLLFDVATGVTIPLSERWHIEPQIRAGYPHIAGASITAGYKFKLPKKTIYQDIEVIKTIPPSEIVKIIKITAIEFILFGPDIGRYNIGIDRDAQQLNELVLNYTAQTLKDNPDFRVRIEGHANPFTINISEAEDLMALSTMRSDTISEQLRQRGVSDEQMVIVAFGGTRNATSEWDVRNRNRRVELMIIQVDFNQ